MVSGNGCLGSSEIKGVASPGVDLCLIEKALDCLSFYLVETQQQDTILELERGFPADMDLASTFSLCL